MNEERLIHEGQRAELRMQRHQLELRLDSLRKAIRLAGNPMTPYEDINADEIFMLATDLRASKIDYQEVQEKLTRIKEILGR